MSRDHDKIVRDLERHKTFLDFTADGMGYDLCKIASDSALENIIGEQTPDGDGWPTLSPVYERWKRTKYAGRPMAVLHFLMSQPQEIAGVVEIEKDQAKVTYGVSQDCRQEASWFAEGSASQNRPPRPFWGLNASALKAVKACLDRRYRSIVG